MRYLIGLTAALLVWAMLPVTAQAAPLPAPTPIAPSASNVDQPIFEWSPVEGAASYEIEIALDDQFVTAVDPPAGGYLTVYGTRYIPLRSYQAKTMYWHVRAVAVDSVKGQWSPTQEFTRRWTNTDEPTGTPVGGVPASRVNNVRVLDGDPTPPPINNVAIQWDPVAGAAYYEVQFSTDRSFQNEDSAIRMTCYTTHPRIAPSFSGEYLRRSTALWSGALNCPVNTPIRPWAQSTWTRSGTLIDISGSGVKVGDQVVVRYSPTGPEWTVKVIAVADGVFTVPDAGAPAVDSGDLEWFKVMINLEVGESYFVRVRAVDYSAAADYPFTSPPAEIKGMWSDHRREPSETPPEPLEIVPSNPVGAGADNVPALPLTDELSSTDFPLLRWEPVPAAKAYRLVIALDRDFTDIVATYQTRQATFIPERTFDDNGANRSYYWYALPCDVVSDLVQCRVADRLAINDDTYVARFAKHSAAVKNPSATLTDSDHQVLLQWGDGLTAAAPDNPGGVSAYQVQWTGGDDWISAASVQTDNLALTTTLAAPMTGGTYRWRVRPLDGDGIGLTWARGPDFTLAAAPKPTASPSPTGSSGPPPGQVTPNPTPSLTYDQNPGGAGGVGNVAPGQPGKPTVTRVANKALKVRWRASQAYTDPVTSYVVMRSTDGSRFTQVARTSARHVRLRAQRKVKYWFYVVAVSAAGRSAQSATTVFTMPKR